MSILAVAERRDYRFSGWKRQVENKAVDICVDKLPITLNKAKNVDRVDTKFYLL